MFRKLGAAAHLLVPALAGQDVGVPPCAVPNVAYNDWKRNSTPNGGYPSSAAECQRLCQDTTYCEHFTYYNNTDGCWLQGDRVEQFYPEVYVVSGPSHCNSETEFTAERSMRQRSEGTVESSSRLGLFAIAAGLLAFGVSGVVFFLVPDERRKQDEKKLQVYLEAGGGALLVPDAEEENLLGTAQVTAVAVTLPRLCVSVEAGAATPCFGSRAMVTPCFAPCAASASATQISKQDDVLRRHEFAAFMARS